MADAKIMDAVTKTVEILEPLSTEERQRVIKASLTLLGDESSGLERSARGSNGHTNDETNPLPPRAQVWMKQNGITADELNQVFHIADGTVQVIAPALPGNTDKEKTYSAYILVGIARLLASGNLAFDDKSARDLCKSSGCFTEGNHATHLKERGNEFTGTKEKGWTMTNPGLKRGAELIKELAKRER